MLEIKVRFHSLEDLATICCLEQTKGEGIKCGGIKYDIRCIRCYQIRGNQRILQQNDNLEQNFILSHLTVRTNDWYDYIDIFEWIPFLIRKIKARFFKRKKVRK